MTVRIKICGITNKQDALAAAQAGADALGFIFAPSPRKMSPEAAREIISTLPPLVQTVGVFVNADPEQVAHTADFCGLDLLQFHGDESVDYCRRFGRRVIKAIRLQSSYDLDILSEYSTSTDAILLDSHVSDKYGGTGVTFDWSIAREASRYGRIILAGGLNPGNIAAAVRTARPYAVDASSGLEVRPGQKDQEKMALFIERVRKAERQ